jgi:hypothetical protein
MAADTVAATATIPATSSTGEKMKKRFSLLFAVLLACLSLTARGKKEEAGRMPHPRRTFRRRGIRLRAQGRYAARGEDEAVIPAAPLGTASRRSLLDIRRTPVSADPAIR